MVRKLNPLRIRSFDIPRWETRVSTCFLIMSFFSTFAVFFIFATRSVGAGPTPSTLVGGDDAVDEQEPGDKGADYKHHGVEKGLFASDPESVDEHESPVDTKVGD